MKNFIVFTMLLFMLFYSFGNMICYAQGSGSNTQKTPPAWSYTGKFGDDPVGYCKYLLLTWFLPNFKTHLYIWIGLTVFLFTLGAYGIFFPLNYYGIRFHPSIAIRVSFAMAILFSYLVWHLLFLTGYWYPALFVLNLWYWPRWVALFLVMILVSVYVLLLPKNKKAF